MGSCSWIVCLEMFFDISEASSWRENSWQHPPRLNRLTVRGCSDFPEKFRLRWPLHFRSNQPKQLGWHCWLHRGWQSKCLCQRSPSGRRLSWEQAQICCWPHQRTSDWKRYLPSWCNWQRYSCLWMTSLSYRLTHRHSLACCHPADCLAGKVRWGSLSENRRQSRVEVQ